MAIQKIAHAEATPEEPAIVGALEVPFVIFYILLSLFISIVCTQPILWLNKKKVPFTIAQVGESCYGFDCVNDQYVIGDITELGEIGNDGADGSWRNGRENDFNKDILSCEDCQGKTIISNSTLST